MSASHRIPNLADKDIVVFSDRAVADPQLFSYLGECFVLENVEMQNLNALLGSREQDAAQRLVFDLIDERQRAQDVIVQLILLSGKSYLVCMFRNLIGFNQQLSLAPERDSSEEIPAIPFQCFLEIRGKLILNRVICL